MLCLLDGFEDVLPKPFGPNCPIVALDVSVLLRLSRLDVADPDAPVLRQCL